MEISNNINRFNDLQKKDNFDKQAEKRYNNDKAEINYLKEENINDLNKTEKVNEKEKIDKTKVLEQNDEINKENAVQRNNIKYGNASSFDLLGQNIDIRV